MTTEDITTNESICAVCGQRIVHAARGWHHRMVRADQPFDHRAIPASASDLATEPTDIGYQSVVEVEVRYANERRMWPCPAKVLEDFPRMATFVGEHIRHMYGEIAHGKENPVDTENNGDDSRVTLEYVRQKLLDQMSELIPKVGAGGNYEEDQAGASVIERLANAYRTLGG